MRYFLFFFIFPLALFGQKTRVDSVFSISDTSIRNKLITEGFVGSGLSLTNNNWLTLFKEGQNSASDYNILLHPKLSPRVWNGTSLTNASLMNLMPLPNGKFLTGSERTGIIFLRDNFSKDTTTAGIHYLKLDSTNSSTYFDERPDRGYLALVDTDTSFIAVGYHDRIGNQYNWHHFLMRYGLDGKGIPGFKTFRSRHILDYEPDALRKKIYIIVNDTVSGSSTIARRIVCINSNGTINAGFVFDTISINDNVAKSIIKMKVLKDGRLLLLCTKKVSPHGQLIVVKPDGKVDPAFTTSNWLYKRWRLENSNPLTYSRILYLHEYPSGTIELGMARKKVDPNLRRLPCTQDTTKLSYCIRFSQTGQLLEEVEMYGMTNITQSIPMGDTARLFIQSSSVDETPDPYYVEEEHKRAANFIIVQPGKKPRNFFQDCGVGASFIAIPNPYGEGGLVLAKGVVHFDSIHSGVIKVDNQGKPVSGFNFKENIWPFTAAFLKDKRMYILGQIRRPASFWPPDNNHQMVLVRILENGKTDSSFRPYLFKFRYAKGAKIVVLPGGGVAVNIQVFTNLRTAGYEHALLDVDGNNLPFPFNKTGGYKDTLLAGLGEEGELLYEGGVSDREYNTNYTIENRALYRYKIGEPVEKINIRNGMPSTNFFFSQGHMTARFMNLRPIDGGYLVNNTVQAKTTYLLPNFGIDTARPAKQVAIFGRSIYFDDANRSYFIRNVSWGQTSEIKRYFSNGVLDSSFSMVTPSLFPYEMLPAHNGSTWTNGVGSKEIHLKNEGGSGDLYFFSFQTYSTKWNFVNSGKTYTVEGSIKSDTTVDCQKSRFEKPWSNGFVSISPTGKIAKPNQFGDFALVADSGNNQVHFEPLGKQSHYIKQTCPPEDQGYSFNLSNSNSAGYGANFKINGDTCPEPRVWVVYKTRVRACENVKLDVLVKNEGKSKTFFLPLSVRLPNGSNQIGATVPFQYGLDSSLTFSLSPLAPGEIKRIEIQFRALCLPISQDICVRATVTDSSLCRLNEWDGSQLSVSHSCSSNAQTFRVTNSGLHMQDSSIVKLFRDSVLVFSKKIKLSSMSSADYTFALDTGAGYRFSARQALGNPYSEFVVNEVKNCESGQSWASPYFSPENNGGLSSTVCTPLRFSFDPNEKVVIPSGSGPDKCVEYGSRLHYTIHFENLGNDTAFKVTILDTLPASLDLSTLEIGNSSHTFNYNIKGTVEKPILEFLFNPIVLPAKIQDSIASKGQVYFSIKPKMNLPLKTKIKNRAAIYFDFNPPVITDYSSICLDSAERDTISVVESIVSTSKLIPDEHPTVYPNPSSKGKFQVQLENANSEISYSVFSIDGLCILANQHSTSSSFLLDLGKQPPGMYFLKILSQNNVHLVRLISH